MANCRICGKMFHLCKVFNFWKFAERPDILVGKAWQKFETCENCYEIYKDDFIDDIPFK